MWTSVRPCFWARDWVQRKIRESAMLTALDHALVGAGR
jgi:hypothetical protein